MTHTTSTGSRLSSAQYMVLCGLNGYDGWLDFSLLRPKNKISARSLKRRGLVKFRNGPVIRGVRRPLYVAITPAGRRAIAEQGE